MPSESDEQRCCGKLSRGRTWVLACHGATSACVKGGTESLAFMAEQAGTDGVRLGERSRGSEVQDPSAMHLAAHTHSMATFAAHISGDAIQRASHTAQGHPSTAFSKHTHIQAVQSTSTVRWTSKVAPPARRDA